MCWVKHNEKGTWSVVTLTFPISFTTIYFVTLACYCDTGGFTEHGTMTHRGASRAFYTNLTNTSVGVQNYQDVYVVIFGI